MKRLFLLTLLCGIFFITNTAHAQLRPIPAVVTEAFKAKYPNAKSVEWKDKLTAFQAGFEMDDAKYTAKFNSKGEWLSTEKALTEADLPAAVKDGWAKSKYADWKIRSVYALYLPKDITQFEVSVSKSDLQKKNLLFNSDGQLLKDNITL